VRKIIEKTVECVTPCLCAGARQDVAEIRAPSIRGALRWWYRALGGDKRTEAEIFGSAAGSSGSASEVVVRVSRVVPGESKGRILTSNQTFFTSGRGGADARLSAGTQFKVDLFARHEFSSARFDLAVETLFRVGSIGLRANRGAGALQDIDWRPAEVDFDVWTEKLRENAFDVYKLERQTKYLDALMLIEEKFKEFRTSKGIAKEAEDAFGYTEGRDGRQSSCLKYRPVKLDDGSYLPIILYTEAGLGERTVSRRDVLRDYFG
jgi:CRISPR type III-B/RAMP module RAMP protein Cmr1